MITAIAETQFWIQRGRERALVHITYGYCDDCENNMFHITIGQEAWGHIPLDEAKKLVNALQEVILKVDDN